MGNLLEPLVDGLFEAVPVLWDKWGNFLYWIIEGKRYDNEVNFDAEIDIEVANIEKYDYIPVEGVKEIKEGKKIVKYEYIEGEKEGIKAYIGVDEFGKCVCYDALNGHTMVGGASRWGKSSFLNVFITTVMITYTPKEVLFVGCDFKKSDIYYYRKYKHFRGMSTNKEQFLQQIGGIKEEMDIRADILDKANCRNVIKYNKKNEKKLSYIIFVIDELVQLVRDKDCSKILHEVMSVSASYGIYFILASQDFTKDTVGKCKMNCSQTLGFHTKDDTDSTTLMGKGADLQDITVKGRCKFDNGETTITTQIFFLEEEEIESYLKPFEKGL